MAKNTRATKTTQKRRAKVKNLPKTSKALSNKDLKKVRGGVAGYDVKAQKKV